MEQEEYASLLLLSKREDCEVLAAVRVGSQVYGTANEESDRDYVLIVHSDLKTDDIIRATRSDKRDVIVRGRTSFTESVAHGNIFALECCFGPSLKTTRGFFPARIEGKNHLKNVVSSALDKARADYAKGVKIDDPTRVYHAFRVLDYALQVVRTGVIADFRSAQALYEMVMTEPRSLDKAFSKLFQLHCSSLENEPFR